MGIQVLELSVDWLWKNRLIFHTKLAHVHFKGVCYITSCYVIVINNEELLGN